LTKEFYRNLDGLFDSLVNTLNGFAYSEILQDFFFVKTNTFFYGNLITNFFSNLTVKNVKELGVPVENIAKIKKKFTKEINDSKSATKLSMKEELSKEYYLEFKKKIKKQFPKCMKIITELEKEINIQKAEKYLSKKWQIMRQTGTNNEDFDQIFKTNLAEAFVQTHNEIPSSRKFEKFITSLTPKLIENFSSHTKKIMDKNAGKLLQNLKKERSGFEKRLQKRWKKPFDLMDILINVVAEVGQAQTKKFAKNPNQSNKFQREALVKIHARSIQISHEILNLLKGGFADGAIARWRSLHELAVISFFLREQNDEVSERYLMHDIMKKFKLAKDYKRFRKRLGDDPIDQKDWKKLKRRHDKMIIKYGNEFEYGNGFEWIPRNILPGPNFRTLEELVKIDHLHPYYNMSTDAIHSGAQGFWRLGLMDGVQDKVLLAGPTNYGLADPLQSTAISILHVTVNLLFLENDFESILQSKLLSGYTDEIKIEAVKVQDELKKESTGI